MYRRIRRVGAVCALVSSFFLAMPAWADGDAAVRSVNGFALRAAGLLGEKPDDFFFSPFSVVPALGMTYAGSRGATASEMESALLLTPEIHGPLGALARELTASLNGKNGAPLLTAANRVWVHKGLTLRPEFAETLCVNYGSAAVEADFEGDPEGAKRAVNAWVEKQTNQRIQNLIREVKPDTRMILTNAVYFMGEWEEPFNAGMTKSAPFHISASETKDVPMMAARRELLYGEAGNVKLLRLPYRGRLSMFLALPEEGPDGMKAALELLGGGEGFAAFEGWKKSLSPHKVDLWLPKFKTEKRYELKELLAALGMKRAFENSADFSGMTDEEKLKIDSVIHQTFIEVDERKTEAAAATSVMMVKTTAVAPRDLPRAEFHADRPFLYFIMDDPTGTILFMGRQGFKE